MTTNITLKIQLKFCGTAVSQELMHLSILFWCKIVWKLVVYLSRWAMKESIQSTSICAEVSTFLVAFRKPFPVPGWIELKNCLHGMCHATQSRHVQDGVVLPGFEVNETLWSLPLELVTVNIPSSSLIICTSPSVYLRDFDRLSKQWMMTDRGLPWRYSGTIDL